MRQKLQNRRDNTTRRVTWMQASGAHADVLVTVGIEGGQVREVFCADSKAFKAGSDQLAIVSDACILFSRLLQHGDLPTDIMASMCEPPSLIGAIAQAVLDEQRIVDAQIDTSDIKEVGEEWFNNARLKTEAQNSGPQSAPGSRLREIYRMAHAAQRALSGRLSALLSRS